MAEAMVCTAASTTTVLFVVLFLATLGPTATFEDSIPTHLRRVEWLKEQGTQCCFKTAFNRYRSEVDRGRFKLSSHSK